MSRPKAGKVGGNLNGPLIGREQMYDQWKATAQNRGADSAAEEVLQTRRNPWGSVFGILDFQLTPTCKGHGFRREVAQVTLF